MAVGQRDLATRIGAHDAGETANEYTTPEPGEGPRTGGDIGQPASEDLMAMLDIDVVPGGEGLPEGSGTVAEGAEVYATHCARCHAPSGTEGGLGPVSGLLEPLAGGPLASTG